MANYKRKCEMNNLHTKISIHEYTSGDLPDDDIQLAKEMILEQIRCEQCSTQIVRPTISVWKDILILTAAAAVTIGFIFLMYNLLREISFILFLLLCMILVVIWCTLFLKRLVVLLIILYQKYAPESLRGACLFEPCCSEYMKLAIVKYGVVSGVFRGIRRILRCRYPNGGVDEP